MTNATARIDIGTMMESPEEMPWAFNVKREALQLRGEDTARAAIIREDTGGIVGYTSDTYNPASYASLLAPIASWLRQEHGPDVEVRYGLSTATKGRTGLAPGSRGYWRFILPDKEAVGDPEMGDAVQRCIDIRSGHDGGTGINGQASILRLVCTNGMVLPDTKASFNMRHTEGWDAEKYAAQVDELLTSVLAGHDGALAQFDNWANTESDAREVRHLLLQMEQNKYPAGWLADAYRAAVGMMADSSAGVSTGSIMDLSRWQVFNAFTDKKLKGMGDMFTEARLNERTYSLMQKLN
jgi:hypothetical protein